MLKVVKVDIPETYLLIIAAHGKMGSGDLPSFMQSWAQRVCRENGLESKLRDLQIENARELRTRISNTLGVDVTNEINATISKAIQSLKGGDNE